MLTMMAYVCSLRASRVTTAEPATRVNPAAVTSSMEGIVPQIYEIRTLNSGSFRRISLCTELVPTAPKRSMPEQPLQIVRRHRLAEAVPLPARAAEPDQPGGGVGSVHAFGHDLQRQGCRKGDHPGDDRVSARVGAHRRHEALVDL